MQDALELLYVDEKVLPRVRKHGGFRLLVDEARKEPAMATLVTSRARDIDERDASVILARGVPVSGDAIALASREAVRDDGKYATPLVLVAGELSLPFDEMEALKVGVSVATPFAGGDEALRSAIDAAKELVAAADLPTSPPLVEGALSRLRTAFAKGRRAVWPGYFDAQLERALTVERRHQTRTFDGKPARRALLTPSGDAAALLGYLPAAAWTRMPLGSRFAVRAIAFVHLAVDEIETHRFALELVALSRSVRGRGPTG